MTSRAAWTIQQILQSMQKLFVQRGIESPRLDSELLLAHVLGVSRVHLYTHYDTPLTSNERETLRGLTKRRLGREPVAYLLGYKEFYSRTFEVTPATLIPRPETEHIVEEVLRRVKNSALTQPRILDLGTGSGILAVTLALELESAHLVATDVSLEALQVAKRNAEKLMPERSIEFLSGDFYEAISGQKPFDIIVSNPPYVAWEEQGELSLDVGKYEPKLALFAEKTGLSALETVICGAHAHASKTALVVVEMGSTQQSAVEGFFRGGYEGVEICHDLAGHPRVVSGWRRAS